MELEKEQEMLKAKEESQPDEEEQPEPSAEPKSDPILLEQRRRSFVAAPEVA